MSLDYNENNILLAKELRREATPQEKHLWYDFLSNYPVRFQRQKAIGDFIADFYCHKAKLVIEVNGSQHRTEEGMQKDEFRTEKPESYDLKAIRFTNRQVDTKFRDAFSFSRLQAHAVTCDRDFPPGGSPGSGVFISKRVRGAAGN